MSSQFEANFPKVAADVVLHQNKNIYINLWLGIK